MKTYSAKPSQVKRAWYVIDAQEAPLGRVASRVAVLLTGKTKPTFTRHIDVGDFVIVINAQNSVLTGKKATDKIYYHHSQYPGGLTEQTYIETAKKDPTKAIYEAVRGMLPVNKLRPERLKRLKIYAGPEHDHAAQQPKLVSVKEGK
jgi:large subunit ribosomal protein L13